MTAIEIAELTKYYGKFMALDNVSLKIPSGRIVGLLGRNGAGKSTLLNCLLGFLKYHGQITVQEQVVEPASVSLKEKVGFIPDVNELDDRLTVQRTLDYVKGVNPAWNEEKARKLLATCDLPLDKKVGKLSKGMKTKLYLLITLALDVNILLLDEPTLGLDIVFRQEFFNTILGDFYTPEKTLIISTHQVEEVEQILTDVIFIDHGRIVLFDEVETLMEAWRVFSLPADRAGELLEHRPLYHTQALGRASAILPRATYIEGAEVSKPSLAELFIAHVGGSHETV